ncbi:VWA domain-containing protein [Ornithinimicrobium avium]|uniref:VWA domain-containing protein n=1 Tax=Ornithinimicrobium avium TaxID=2283195 RepID=A0A345NLU5_9MICO|nr:VWA domain-containing protein [Ornithinimicrobium avium]AXH96003.1 VWA domain-containing protein [Ornithinimicrobium avium]
MDEPIGRPGDKANSRRKDALADVDLLTMSCVVVGSGCGVVQLRGTPVSLALAMCLPPPPQARGVTATQERQTLAILWPPTKEVLVRIVTPWSWFVSAVASLGLLTVGGGAAQSMDEDRPSAPVVHFVVDVSGSMSGTPLEMAKEAVSAAATSLPEGTAMGLRSYAGSCDQSSVAPIVPIDVGTAAEVESAVLGLVAGGGTPTTSALGQAAADIREYGSDGEQRIVLLTDGDTSCGISICEYVKGSAFDGIDVALYSVGLQVSGTTAADLSCAADATNGAYIPAGDPGALVDALLQATGGVLDVDEDGLPDPWEDSRRDLGYGVFSTALHDLGAGSDKKDVVLVVEAQKGVMPNEDVWERLVDAFAAAPVANPDGSQGIRLHVVQKSTPLTAEQGDEIGSLATQADNDWSFALERLSTDERGWAHYMASIHSAQADFKGRAQARGQALVVNFCAGESGKGTPQKCRGSAKKQAAVIMHELGHNFGLQHGGVVEGECPGASTDLACEAFNAHKPNYLSVMNYDYMNHGEIPGAGVDYSRWGPGVVYTLNELNLNETVGLWMSGADTGGVNKVLYHCEDGNLQRVNSKGAINWDCSDEWFPWEKYQDGVSANIDLVRPPYYEYNEAMMDFLGEKIVMTPFDDWAYIDQNSRQLNGGEIGKVPYLPPDSPTA